MGACAFKSSFLINKTLDQTRIVFVKDLYASIMHTLMWGEIIRRVFNSGLLNHRLHCKNITNNISPHWQGALMGLSNSQCYLPVLGENPEIYFLTPRESRLLQVISLWLLRPLESQTRRVRLIWYCHIMSPVLVEWLSPASQGPTESSDFFGSMPMTLPFPVAIQLTMRSPARQSQGTLAVTSAFGYLYVSNETERSHVRHTCLLLSDRKAGHTTEVSNSWQVIIPRLREAAKNS